MWWADRAAMYSSANDKCCLALWDIAVNEVGGFDSRAHLLTYTSFQQNSAKLQQNISGNSILNFLYNERIEVKLWMKKKKQ